MGKIRRKKRLPSVRTPPNVPAFPMRGNSVTTTSTTPLPYKLKTFLYSKQQPIVDVHETTSPTSIVQKITPSTTTTTAIFTRKPPAYTSTSAAAVNDAVRQNNHDANV